MKNTMLYVETEFNYAKVPLYKIIAVLLFFVYSALITIKYMHEDLVKVAKYKTEIELLETKLLLLEEEARELEEKRLEIHANIREKI